MADEDSPRRTSPGPGRLTPEEVANRTFSHQFRGVSDTEVRNYLRRVSDELLRLRTTENDLRGRIEALEGQIKNPPAPTEQQLLESLGEETARVLRSANEAAEEIRSKAEARAGLLVSEAQTQSDRLREESAELWANRTREAEAVDGELRAIAEADAARVVEAAAADAEAVRVGAADAAAAELEAAKVAGRGMVAESRAVRERVLGDLDKRRELLQTQVDELRRGREGLIEAYRVVKVTLDAATEALAQVEERASSELGHSETAGPQPVVTVTPVPAEAPPAEPRPAEPRPAEPLAAKQVAAGLVAEVEAAVEAAEPSAGSIAVGEAPGPAVAAEPDPATEAVLPGERAPDAAEPDAAVALAVEAVTEAAAPARRTGIRGYLRSSLGYETDAADQSGAVEISATPEATEVTAPTINAPLARDVVTGVAAETEIEPAAEAPAAVDDGEPRDVGALFAKLRAEAGTEAGSASDELASEEPAASDEPGTGTVVLHEVTIDDLTVVVTADAGTDGASSPAAAAESRAAEAESRPVQARAARDLALTKVGRDLARRAKRTLQDDQNALLDALRTQRGRPVAEKVLPRVEEQIEVWTTVLSDAVHAAFAAGYATVDDPADSELPVGLAGELAEALVVPLRERLVHAIAGDSADSGEDDDIAGRVSARFREWKNQNLENALGDGLAVAYARGVYEAAPPGSLLEWVPAVLGRCPDCDDNALEPTLRGQCFPTGQPFPPAHPGCRCLLLVAGSVLLESIDAGRAADR